MSLKDFQIMSKLGSGSFSTVFKAKRISDGKIYALKQVKMGMLSSKERVNALNEIRILGYYNKYFNLSQLPQITLIQFNLRNVFQMKFCEDGDIAMKGLNALHQLTILHRDIKCANIFLTKSQCKLGDLNVSKVSKNCLVQTQTGTPYYAAPEIWKDQKYDGKCDIWSLGCVLYEIAALQPPFRAHGLKELNSKIQAGKYTSIPKIYSNDLADIIGQCLKVRPQLRPTTEQLLNNPIIQQHDKKGQLFQGQNAKLSKEQLLATIKLPRNLGALKEKLPKQKYQEKLNSSFEKKDKQELEINTEPDSQKIPDYLYKDRISSAHPQRKIDIYKNIEKDELKQQKLQIEKEQQELIKKQQMQANRKKDIQISSQKQGLQQKQEQKPEQKKEQKPEQKKEQKPEQKKEQKLEQKQEQKQEQKEEQKKIAQNQQITKSSQNKNLNRPPTADYQYRKIEEMKKKLPSNQIPSPVISIHHEKDFKNHKYLNQQKQKIGNNVDKPISKAPSQQYDKINFSRPQSEKKFLQQNKIQQQVQKVNEMNNYQPQQKPNINQKPVVNQQRIKSAQYQYQRNYGNQIIYKNNNEQKKPQFQVWEKQLGQKQIIAQNALQLKKK